MTREALANSLIELRTRLSAIGVNLVVGLLVGTIAVGVFSAVGAAQALWQVDQASGLGYSWVLGAMMIGAALVAGQLLRSLPANRPQGPADLIEAAQAERVPDLRAGWLSSLLALVNLSGASSVGIFGPLAHLGGCLASLGRRFEAKVPMDVVLGSGAGAAVASVFAAPIGAAIFAHEAIIRRFGVFGAGPVLACTFAAYWVSDQWLGGHRLFQVTTVPTLDGATTAAALVVGALSGLASAAFIWLGTSAPTLARRSGLPVMWRPLLPALILFALSPWLPQLLGSGMSTVEAVIAGQLGLGLLVLLIVGKCVMTSLCLGFGFYGGVFAPALFIGAMVGALVGGVLVPAGDASDTFALLGAASCIGAVIGAPMASVVIMLELTGSYAWAVLSMISVVTATQLCRAIMGRSFFDRQLMQRGVNVDDDHPPSPAALR
jgi:CIC family chloride channel protein